MKREFQCILFDLGNVIIDIDYQETFDQLVTLLNPKIDEEERRAHILRLNDKYEQGLISSELFINGLLSICPPRVHAKQVIDAWNAMLLDIPLKRLQWLEALSKQYEVAILSNTNELHIQWVDQFLNKHYGVDSLHHYVHHIFYSHELKDRKPNPSIYRKVAQHMALPEHAMLFIDDKLENVSAALQVGMKGLHSPDHIEVMDQLKPLLKI